MFGERQRLFGVLVALCAATAMTHGEERNLYTPSQGVIKQQRRSYYFWSPAEAGSDAGAAESSGEAKRTEIRNTGGVIRQEITLLPPPASFRSLSPPSFSLPAKRHVWVDAARAAARKYQINETVFLRLIRQESGFNPYARSRAGALGLAQLMPDTARSLGVNPFHPLQNLEGGARYLSAMLRRFNGDYTSALAAYNAGPAAVEAYQQGRPLFVGGKWINRRGIRSTIPPYRETMNYVRSILGSPSVFASAVRTRPAVTAEVVAPAGIDPDRLNMDQPLSPAPVMRTVGVIETPKRVVRSFYIFE